MVDSPPRLWLVFLTYVMAFVAIVLFSTFAVLVVRSIEPDLPDAEALAGLRGLLAGGVASSTALVFTLFVVARWITPARWRLRPGGESGRHLLVMIVGVLALGQSLDSLTTLAGLSDRGAMEAIRQALVGASGPELFGAVVVIGVMAGIAEEIFFRGFMQSLLRERWHPASAVITASACFGLLHLDWIHAPLAFALGLYLGYITELSGSALPAAACHVVNNAVFTVLTAVAGSVVAFWPNVALLAVSGLVFVGCVLWLHQMMPSAPS